MKNLIVLVLMMALTAVSVQAVIVTNYDSGVAATLGTGAADPTTQGWTAVGFTAGWNNGLDSGGGGWRINDGSNQGGTVSYYETTLGAAGASALASSDWTATWTVASNADVIRSTSSVDNWTMGGNQINNSFWVESATNFRYILEVKDSAITPGTMAIYDGTNTFELTGHGWSQEVGAETPAMDFVTLTLSYDASTGTATLSEGATVYGTVATWGGATKDRVIFGATNSAGKGSTTWNQLLLEADVAAANTPDPENGELDVETDLSVRDESGKVSWAAPDAYTGATYDVYFGTTEPNFNDPAPYGLTQIGTAGQAATSAAPSLPLLNDTPYHWVVDTREPNALAALGYDVHQGNAWSFTTITALPVIDTQPLSKTAASVDLVIEVTNPGTYEWYQVGTPDTLVQSTTTTATSDTYTTGVEGYYYCLVTNAALPAGLQSDVVRVMNPRLVGHWELNGDLTDSSTEGQTGDYVDPNTAEPNPDDSLVDYVIGADGTTDGAVKFNGYNLVEIPDSNEFFYFHKQGLTLTAWVLGPSSGIWKRAVDTNNYGIVQHDSNSIAVIVSNTGGWKTVVPGSEGSEDEWRFVAITYEPNDLDPSNGVRTDYGIYDDDDIIDVFHKAVYTTGTPGGSIQQNLSIGGSELDNPDTPYNYDGAVDDVRIYNYALTEAEIVAVYGLLNDDPLCLTLDDPAIAPYDYNNDCKVTMEDFAIFSATWLDSQLVTP